MVTLQCLATIANTPWVLLGFEPLGVPPVPGPKNQNVIYRTVEISIYIY